MCPIHDDELINHPALRSAMAAQRAKDAEPLRTRSRHWLIGWLIIVVAIGVPLIVLIGLIHLAG
jgi:hypothetical protein